MKIKLENLKLKNFKGIKDLEINFNCKDTNIYGDNATGKTTIFDAFLWVLFNKNSIGKSDFEWKPLNIDGSEVHFLDTEVEICMDIDGTLKKFRKRASEKWVKKRGSLEQIYEGNETNYWIDEVPMKQSEYQRIIESIIPEQKFKMITNPLYFNTQMSADEQRTVISAIAEINNITDERIMHENEEFTTLCENLNGRSVDDFLKVVKETIKNLNKEIDSIPVRIDEVNKTLILVDERELKQAKDTISACEIQENILKKSITDVLDKQNLYKEKFNKLSTLQKELKELENNIYIEKNGEISEKRNKLIVDITNLQNEIKTDEARIDILSNSLLNQNTELENLRKNFDDESQKSFVDENNYICPVCNREYEEATKHEMYDKAKEKFVEAKNKVLEEINLKGKRILELANSNKRELEDIKTNLEVKKNNLQKLKNELDNSHLIEVNCKDDDRYVSKENEISLLKSELDSIIMPNSSKEEENLKEVQKKIDEARVVISKKESQIAAEQRIEELKNKEKELAMQIQEQEGLKNSIEQFTKTKISLLEEKINENFNLVKFKLFDNQINGGIKEVCYATVDGVPFSDLNSAMKINAGLDIIRTLMKFYNVQAPLFIDNKETINSLIDIETQIISLVVSHDSKLRIEVQE